MISGILQKEGRGIVNALVPDSCAKGWDRNGALDLAVRSARRGRVSSALRIELCVDIQPA